MLTDSENPVTKQDDDNDASPDNLTVRVDKIEVVKKPDKEADAEDPKPRIVLTFRSEKSGARSSNMKIVSTEEKHEDISPRRSIRRRNTINYNYVKESDDDNISHADSDDDEPIESMTHKRSTRRRSKDFSDVIANAIARKEKSYNESSSVPTQRLSRRIKPTAKILANEELRMGLESQNNARLGISTEKTTEEGVRTRRSAQVRNSESVTEKRSSKRKIHEDSTFESKDGDNSNKKLMHMGTLGLKIAKEEDSSEAENRKTESSAHDGEDEEIDDDTEVISQLLQADEESASDEDFCPDTSKRRRSRRNCSPAPLRRSSRKANLGLYNYDAYQFDDIIDSDFEPKRKTTRTHTEEPPSEDEPETKIASEAVGGEEEESEPAAPSEAATVVATCLCEETSNVYAAPADLTEPVFCQAIEMVEGVRVGCSHRAARAPGGELLALRRPGLRAPYFLACKLHAAQLAKHMCCPTCGLFCTQGIFYQCSKDHLFHVECGIGGEARQRAGCPHCGVLSHRWQPLNTDYGRVRIDMHCSNKRVFLPDQREQCTPAFLGFSSLDPALLDPEPTFPDDLLPLIPDVKKLIEAADDEDRDHCTAQNIYDLIMTENDAEQVLTKIVRCDNINECVPEASGGTLAHAAAVRGRLAPLSVLRARGADLDAADSSCRTPLMRAIQALLDKEHSEETEFEGNEAEVSVKKEDEVVANDEDKVKTETEDKEDAEHELKDGQEVPEDPSRPADDELLSVIKYLIAAGCDVNKQGPEGMSGLHMSCQYGGAAVCLMLLEAGAAVDARDHGGWTPLVRAAENKHAAVVRLLLAAGADAASCDNEGNQPIHWCTLAGDSRCLAMILRAAPHATNAPNAHTDTPLHIAAREGHYSSVVVLLAHGARTDIENSSGELPVEVCSGPCHEAISMNMQMTLAVKDTMTRVKVITSDLSNGREPYPVSVVNEVDDASPAAFTYVSQHVLTEHLTIDNTIETMQGCECAGGSCDGECGCCVLSVRRWYRAGRLPPAFPHHDPPVMFECNYTCGCNMKRCTNRVVGRMESAGSLNTPVQVFRTRTRGWGLRVLTRVSRGELLALYRGELVTSERADARTDDQYMFALDLKPDLLEQCSDKTLLCVDACRFGSAARFMNHSCRPSAAPVRVFTSGRDLRLPHVAFFALRDLAPGDELTFDYGDKFWSVKSKWMKCECESPDCRYPTKMEEADT
ncbi:histone-lysine N-methyltransferase EHMT2 like protein [Danaus plexippus plexippus]|uniref:Histone-lysine N-methyltransferase EHMT2 like protein n=1 Tax=Danaus plexippus plexippus TaxID=278856 RepID=A0A212FB81_DANPL|nr:histone-lysine N-methyltransferase EHMT2 like protein [Danaus plexippus plexippus]